MITMTELSKLWKEITPQYGNSIGRRADSSHPLDFFVTFDEHNYLQLMLLSAQALDLPASSQQILVRGNVRSDGKFAICFSLANDSLHDMFVALCWDIMDCTYRTENQVEGVFAAIKRFRMWQMLFAEMHNKKMSDEEFKGLLGELYVLKTLCIPEFGVDAAVAGWVGPLKADRDFEYAAIWLEVKCTSGNRDIVSISSYDQLDIDAPGDLVICRFDKTPQEVPASITLNKMVESLRQIVGQSEYAAAVFNSRLFLYNYKAEDDRASLPYVFSGMEKYRVSDQFPRIRRSLIPDAICDGKYSINLAAIQAWRVD